MSEKNAFVAGATGYTGRAVVEALRAVNVHAIAHVRPDSPRLEEWRTRFAEVGAEVDATPFEEAALTATLALRKPEIVFGLLGTTRKRAQGEGLPAAVAYDAIDYGLTAMLVRAAVVAGYGPRFVYLSSVGVSDEARGAYLEARARVERELTASGLPFTIARPSFITGDRDESRPLETVSARVGDALLGAMAALGGEKLRDRYGSTDAKTLASKLVQFALDPEAQGRVLEGADLR
jgi:nucleoside-diphosphate-sugar epimerase